MRKNIVYIIIFLIVAFFVWQIFLKKDNTPQISEIPLTTKSLNEVESNLGVTLPSSGEKIVLNDKTNLGINAVAIKDKINVENSISLLADLPENNDKYQAFLVNKNTLDEIFLGDLIYGKGGYFIDYVTDKDILEFNKIVVKTSNNIVLEGEFELK